MNYKFIQNIQIDWTRIGDYSYIRNIPALQLWSYFLRAESFYNVATKEEEYSDWAHPSKEGDS